MAFMRATVFIVNSSSRIYAIDLSNWHLTPLPSIFGWLVVEWFACMGGMYYFEKVLSVGYGVRSHPLFCLHGWCLAKPGRWSVWWGAVVEVVWVVFSAWHVYYRLLYQLHSLVVVGWCNMISWID